jgi:cobalt-precorrin-5B (C1)-methyltransferase
MSEQETAPKVLIFGGTTEGKKVAALFDTIGQSYIYSTKTDAHKNIKGHRIWGDMDVAKMKAYCREMKINILVDAAHPFAINLHSHVHQVAGELNIPLVRFERNYPGLSETELVKYFDSWEAMMNGVEQSGFERLLALTGVQTIVPLRRLWTQRDCTFRIMDTALSRQKAKESGIDMSRVVPMHPEAEASSLIKVAQACQAQVLLSKESGESGLIETKLDAARALNIPLWIVKRPALPAYDFEVNTSKNFLSCFYQLRKKVNNDKENLRGGFTSGTCVTAAAKACLIALKEGSFPASVSVKIPSGEEAVFPVFDGELGKNRAQCVVIKDAGDDPDVSHGKAIGCKLMATEAAGIHFKKGVGVGKVTLPGLQVAVGEPAINPMPRKMITEMLRYYAEEFQMNPDFIVRPFVPEGEALAQQTFNPRVGVIGGISILGTSGKVIPYSNQAFLRSIRQQINVASEMGCHQVVISSGKRSENLVAQRFPGLPSQAFIHYGNLVGETLALANCTNIREVHLSIMFGKAIKLAEGHLDTHSKRVVFNPDFACQMAIESGWPTSVGDQIKALKLANAIPDIIPLNDDRGFYLKIAKACHQTCLKQLEAGVKLVVYLSVGGEMIVVD